MIRLNFKLFICFCFGNFIGFSQTNTLPITPSQTKIDIESYTLIWSQTVIESDGSKRKGINTMTDKVTVSNDTIIRSMHWVDTSNNTYTKTDVLKASSLEPLSIDIRWNPEYVQHTDIINQNYISNSLNNSKSRLISSTNQLDDIGFTWSSDGFALISILDKDIKDSFALQVINDLPHEPKIGIKKFKIIKEELLDIKGIGTVSTKKIEALNSGKTKIFYWLSNSKPYIIKVKFKQENGQITTWNIETLK
nr:hypothetical protein [uncultured Psychroserpens sp.]